MYKHNRWSNLQKSSSITKELITVQSQSVKAPYAYEKYA